MTNRNRFALIVLTLACCVGCDQQTKSFAAANLRGHQGKSFLADTVRFDYAENTGSFLGLGDSLPAKWRTAIFTYGCTAGVAAMLGYVFFAAGLSAVQVLALSLITAGGIGNVIDRWICGGYVRDFLNVGIGPLRTGIFNVADAAMMAGCVLALFTFSRRPASPRS
jgi:signal peptidase II